MNYGSNTRFSDSPQRVINSRYAVFPRNRLPPSILSANIGDAFILEEYILVEKFGLGGSFRGFRVYNEGADIWTNDKSVTRLEGCSYCLEDRIVDGLYWYHAAPVEEENARLDFCPNEVSLQNAAQQSVHWTLGSLRHLKQLSRFEFSYIARESPPAPRE